MTDYQASLMGKDYRLVLKTPIGEFYSETKPYTGFEAVRDDIYRIGALMQHVHRAEVWTGKNWELI